MVWRRFDNEKHLKNVGPVRHCEPPHALILHCHSPGVVTVARRLRIDVHDNANDNACQRGPLWPHRMGPITCMYVYQCFCTNVEIGGIRSRKRASSYQQSFGPPCRQTYDDIERLAERFITSHPHRQSLPSIPSASSAATATA